MYLRDDRKIFAFSDGRLYSIESRFVLLVRKLYLPAIGVLMAILPLSVMDKGI
jgi:hypothetical protein